MPQAIETLFATPMIRPRLPRMRPETSAIISPVVGDASRLPPMAYDPLGFKHRPEATFACLGDVRAITSTSGNSIGAGKGDPPPLQLFQTFLFVLNVPCGIPGPHRCFRLRGSKNSAKCGNCAQASAPVHRHSQDARWR